MSLRRFGKILLIGFAGLLVLMMVLTLAVKLTLDRAPQYQAQIKEWVREQTGYHIAFAHVSPAFRWYGPELYFDQLELRSKDDRRVLARAAGGRIGADIWQLLQSGRLFALRIELDSPNIVVARVGPNTFALASEIVLGGENTSFGTLALNDFPAGILAIRNGLVTVQNWNSELPQLELHGVRMDLRRGADRVALGLTAQLPAVLGGTFRFDGSATGAGRLATLDWDVLTSARGMSFPGWRELFPDYLARLDGGTGSFELRARGEGSTRARADFDFDAQGVITKLADGPSAKFERISGALTLTHEADRWDFSGRRLHALTGGHRDPDSEFDVNWRGNDSGVMELRAQASYLRAEALLPLAGLMPQKDVRDRLRDLAPTGEWMNMRVQLSRGSVNDPWQLQTRAQFRGVGIAPVGHSPGLRGLSGTLAGNENGGEVVINTQTAVFNWPSQFPRPIDLPVLKATLYWKRTADELLVATSDFAMNTPDASVRGKIAWRQPSDGSSPILTLASVVENGNAADARFYFPKELISPGALTWLNRAFVAGHLSHADVVFSGPVRRFPFRDGGGLFLARCNLDGMILDYHEGWARVEGLVAQAEFRNQGMTARLTSGRIGAVKLESADARFGDFKNGELEIHAAAFSDAGDALQYLRATPLDGMAENAFSSIEAKGEMESTVSLFLPFKDFDHRRVQVHVNLNGATLNRIGSTLAATDVVGDADIDGAQVARADMRGRVLGGSFQMTARAPRNRPVTRTQLDFHGTLSGEALRAALGLPANIPIDGQTDWRGLLKMSPEPARERSLHITSTLAGLELKLPEPLAKPAGDSLPASLDLQWPTSGGVQLKMALGSVLRGALILDTGENGPKLRRAAVAFGTADPVFGDSQAVNVGGSIDELDLAGWLALGASAKGAKPLTNYLRSAALEVAKLNYLGVTFLDVALDLTEASGGWRVSVSGPNVVGTISLPDGANPVEPWTLEFARLKFIDGRPETGPTGAPQASADPRGIPAINFHASDLEWGERQFGDVRATLSKLDDGISLRQLAVTGPNYSASATGEWRGKDAGSGRIEGTITSSDVGDTLKQMGFDAVIEAKTGHLDFDMTWAGAPTADSLESAKGMSKSRSTKARSSV